MKDGKRHPESIGSEGNILNLMWWLHILSYPGLVSGPPKRNFVFVFETGFFGVGV